MADHVISSSCPDCRKSVRIVWYDSTGRHVEDYVEMFVMMQMNVYHVSCPFCGSDFTYTMR